MKQIFGIYNCNDGQFTDLSSGIDVYEDDGLLLLFAGNPENDKETILPLFHKNGREVTKVLKGQYIAVAYDKNKKEINVFQDRVTSPLTFYYTLWKETVYFGTSIKKILLESGMDRKLNEGVLGEFVTNGFIYGKDTLIKEIYKIESFKGLTIVGNHLEQFPAHYSLEEYEAGEALGKWRDVLNRAIISCFADKKEINMPLSSGYDSNYIAYVASTYGNRPINAFSVGGKIGKNEIPIVRDNAAEYKDMTLYTSLTDETSLNRFPEIVWRLEGSVYESGLFLQYELAKLVSGKMIHDLVCGECADQVMNVYYLDKDRIEIKEHIEPIYYEFSEYPYIFGSYLILKKNGILANSFDINTYYPFLNDDFVSVAYALRRINMKDKRVHTATCRELLSEKVVNNMSKIGGSTELHSLFKNKEEIEKFISCIEMTDFYQKHKTVFEKYSNSIKEKQTGIKKIKTKIRNTAMDILHINDESRKTDAYFYDELRLREYLSYAYLMLFDKLFVSGEYDTVMRNESFEYELNDIL